MKIAFFGAAGKTGSAVARRLAQAGHEVRGIELGDEPDVSGCDVAVDFTTPEAAPANVRAALEQGVSCVVGTTGWDPAELGALAEENGLRLFVALDIPQEVRDSLAALRARLEPLGRTARWVRIDGAHITLKFIGEVSDERADEIRATLAGILTSTPRFAPFTTITLRFAGLGFFPNERRPRVLWAGIEAGPELAQLAGAVDGALVPLGVPTEAREFRPHLTLARFESPAGLEPLRAAAAELATAEFGRATIDAFHLYRSILNRSGAEYTRLATYPFSSERAA